MGIGTRILDGLRDAAAGNLERVSFPVNGKLETWVRHAADSPEGHLALARECIADLQTQVDACESEIERLGKMLAEVDGRAVND